MGFDVSDPADTNFEKRTRRERMSAHGERGCQELFVCWISIPIYETLRAMKGLSCYLGLSSPEADLLLEARMDWTREGSHEIYIVFQFLKL